MKKKYIIALEDRNVWSCGFPAKTLLLSDVSILGTDLASVNTGIELTPYTEPDLEQVRKEAYEKGFDAGRTLNTDKYEKGLADAWEAARKIHRMPEGDILDLFPDCYASVCTAAQVIVKYDASEAIDKIKEHEDGKQEIKVGDEVEWNGDRYTVTYIDVDETYADVIDCSCGSVCERIAIKNLDKTGRHFPEIASVLQKMRGDSE